MEQYGLVEFDQEYDRLRGFWDKFNEQKDDRRRLMGNMLNVVIRAVARHGNAVILGRGRITSYNVCYTKLLRAIAT